MAVPAIAQSVDLQREAARTAFRQYEGQSKIDRVTVVAPHALITWLSGEMGGQGVMKLNQGRL